LRRGGRKKTLLSIPSLQGGGGREGKHNPILPLVEGGGGIGKGGREGKKGNSFLLCGKKKESMLRSLSNFGLERKKGEVELKGKREEGFVRPDLRLKRGGRGGLGGCLAISMRERRDKSGKKGGGGGEGSKASLSRSREWEGEEESEKKSLHISEKEKVYHRGGGGGVVLYPTRFRRKGERDAARGEVNSKKEKETSLLPMSLNWE